MVTRDVFQVLKIARAAAETFFSRIALEFWLITEENKTHTHKNAERLEICLAVVIIKFQFFT